MTWTMPPRAALLLGALALLATTPPLRSQGPSINVAAGAALPVGGTGERHGAGSTALISVVSSPSVRGAVRMNLRLDAEWAWLPSRVDPSRTPARELRAMGVSLNVVSAPVTDGVTPYLLVGLGAYHLQRAGEGPSAYGPTPAVQLGAGLDGPRRRRVRPFAEVRALVHVTDYASREFSPSVWWPVTVGVRVR